MFVYTSADTEQNDHLPEVVFVSSLFKFRIGLKQKTSFSLATWGTQWRDEKLTLNVVRCLADNVRQVLEVWTNKRTESELKE